MKTYVDRTLMPGEVVVHRARRHWLVFARPALVFVAALVATAAGWWPLGALLAAAAIVDLGITWVVWVSTEYAVTNMRVVVKRGIVRFETSETLLRKVESVDVRQGVLGRMMDYGDVLLRGTGGSVDPFLRVARPFELRRHVQEQVMRAPVTR